MKRFISLLSGGFDSPVASYLMMRKGFTPIFLSFITSQEDPFKKKILKIIELLKIETSDAIRIYFLNHKPILTLLKEDCARKLTCILCKRMMIRVAKSLGTIEGTNKIVTGDILGEQASQTIDNLFAYNNLVKGYTIIRPLIGYDKLEIIELSKQLGLYEVISTSVGDCEYNPQYPETRARQHEIRREENLINIDKLISESIARAEILDI